MEIDKIKRVFVVQNRRTFCMSFGEPNGRWYEAEVLRDTEYDRHRLVRVIKSSDGSKKFEKWAPNYDGTIEIPKQSIKEFKRV